MKRDTGGTLPDDVLDFFCKDVDDRKIFATPEGKTSHSEDMQKMEQLGQSYLTMSSGVYVSMIKWFPITGRSYNKG